MCISKLLLYWAVDTLSRKVPTMFLRIFIKSRFFRNTKFANCSNYTIAKAKQTTKKLPGELVSTGLYSAFDFFIQKYHHLLPYTFSMIERKLVMGKTCSSRRILIFLSFLIEMLHILLSFFILLSKVSGRKINFTKLDDTETVRRFILFYVIILPMTFITVNFIIALKPWSMFHICNSIDSLRIQILGKFKTLKVLNFFAPMIID